MSTGPRLVPGLERATFAAEKPVRRWVGSNRLNPLPYAGTISVFLLIVVIVSGVYITLFYGFGFEASYDSVRRMEAHPIQNVVRSIHRYASAALVLTTLVHAWRVFVAGRFRGPRRWRWTTGVAALATVWLAGVSGYWLVWDRRAGALNEAVIATVGGVRWASEVYVRDVLGSDAGSGWSVLFLIWVGHLLLTAVVGWFLWRHVRRTRLGLLPPRHWMIAMGAALLLVSVLLPADLLGPADPARLVGDMPLDPFVLFLLPPLLDGWGWLALAVLVAVVGAALVLPHLLRRSTPVVAVDTERCTGCELCVIDCPYLALTMGEASVAADDGTQPRRPIAVVDEAACVGCGICLGSCSFGALALPGHEPVESVDPARLAGRRVVLACARHVAATGPVELGEDVEVVEVACSGMVHAGAVGAVLGAGAASVQVVGCPPGDCAFGLGNVELAERLAGSRAPHVARRWKGTTAEDFVAPTELARAVAEPGLHPAADAADPPRGRRLVAAAVLVVVSVVAVGLATRAPFRSHGEEAAVRVLVDHGPGRALQGREEPSGEPGDDVAVAVRRDGIELDSSTLATGGGFAVGIVDVPVDVGAAELTVALVQDGVETEVFDGPVSLVSGQRFVVEAVDEPPPPGVADGKEVFADRSRGGCGVCHSTERGDDGVGPSLYGVADTAATRQPGMDAAAYLRESLLDPDAFIVPGYRAGQMLPTYRERLSDAEVDAVVEYLLTLRGEVGDEEGS